MPTRPKTLPQGLPPLLTIEQVATLLQISICQADRLVRDGAPAIDIAVPKPGRRTKHAWRFREADLMAWLEQRARRAA